MRVLVALLALGLLCSCKQELHSRVNERDANEILAVLYAAGISAVKRPGEERTWSVELDEAELQRALQVLREHGLPRESFVSTGDIFKKEGLISTPSEERIRFIYAVSQELANTLTQIDGVVTARVHPVIPANDPLASVIRPSSAAVFIKYRRDANLQSMAPAIRNLVMRGIEGLTYENIALTFVVAEEPSLRSDAESGLATADTWPGVVHAALVVALIAMLAGMGYLWRKRRFGARRSSATRSASGSQPRARERDTPERRAEPHLSTEKSVVREAG